MSHHQKTHRSLRTRAGFELGPPTRIGSRTGDVVGRPDRPRSVGGPPLHALCGAQLSSCPTFLSQTAAAGPAPGTRLTARAPSGSSSVGHAVNCSPTCPLIWGSSAGSRPSPSCRRSPLVRYGQSSRTTTPGATECRSAPPRPGPGRWRSAATAPGPPGGRGRCKWPR